MDRIISKSQTIKIFGDKSMKSRQTKNNPDCTLFTVRILGGQIHRNGWSNPSEFYENG